jgi:hypothetical protein
MSGCLASSTLAKTMGRPPPRQLRHDSAAVPSLPEPCLRTGMRPRMVRDSQPERALCSQARGACLTSSP